MERPAASASPWMTSFALVGGVSAVAMATLVHAVWWWLERYDWGNDFQGTYEELHEGLADPWFWSVEVGCVAVVVVVALGVLVWGARSRALVAVVVVEAAALVGLAQMASLRLLLPSRSETQLPTEASGECCSYPGGEISVADAALLRAVLLTVVLVGGVIKLEGAVAARRVQRTQ